MLSGPGPPPDEFQQLLERIGMMSSQEEKLITGKQVLQLCQDNQALIVIAASSMEFLSVLPSLLEFHETGSFVIAALSLSNPQMSAVVKILQQILSSGENLEPLPKIVRAFLESNWHDERKNHILLEQGVLQTLVQVISLYTSNIDQCCELLRTSGVASSCSFLVRQEC